MQGRQVPYRKWSQGRGRVQDARGNRRRLRRLASGDQAGPAPRLRRLFVPWPVSDALMLYSLSSTTPKIYALMEKAVGNTIGRRAAGAKVAAPFPCRGFHAAAIRTLSKERRPSRTPQRTQQMVDCCE